MAALTGGPVTSAVNVPAIASEDMEVLGPFLPLSRHLGKLAVNLAAGSIDRIEVSFMGRVAERDTRALTTAVLLGALSGHTEDEVNAVNAPSLAEERGIDIVESKSTTARDFADLVRVTVVSGEDRSSVVGTVVGHRNRPHLLEAWGQRFNLQLEDHIAIFRYRDVPGMIGKVGTIFGEHGVNINGSAVGRVPDDKDRGLAAMVVTTDEAVPRAVIDEIVALDAIADGRAVDL